MPVKPALTATRSEASLPAGGSRQSQTRPETGRKRSRGRLAACHIALPRLRGRCNSNSAQVQELSGCRQVKHDDTPREHRRRQSPSAGFARRLDELVGRESSSVGARVVLGIRCLANHLRVAAGLLRWGYPPAQVAVSDWREFGLVWALRVRCAQKSHVFRVMVRA